MQHSLVVWIAPPLLHHLLDLLVQDVDGVFGMDWVFVLSEELFAGGVSLLDKLAIHMLCGPLLPPTFLKLDVLEIVVVLVNRGICPDPFLLNCSDHHEEVFEVYSHALV